MWLIRFDKKKTKKRTYSRRKPKGFFDTRDIYELDLERSWKKRR